MDAEDGATTLSLRKQLAARAYARTAQYDAAIGTWFASQLGDDAPRALAIAGTLAQGLRYGENPHHWAAFYRTAEQRPGVATARQVQGKELSYNNLNDTDAAYELAAEFDPGKHAARDETDPTIEWADKAAEGRLGSGKGGSVGCH